MSTRNTPVLQEIVDILFTELDEQGTALNRLEHHFQTRLLVDVGNVFTIGEYAEQFLYNKDNHGNFVLKIRPKFQADASGELLEDVIGERLDSNEIPETVRKYLLKVRIGQEAYRKDLIALWGECSVTGCKNELLLRASHIKPWSVSNRRESLDCFNGLLLTPALDLLFDKGLISFSESGRILLSSHLNHKDALILGINKNLRVQGLRAGNKPYLREHRRLHGFAS